MKPTHPLTKWKRGGGGEKGIVKLDVKNEWSDISTNAYHVISHTTTTLPSAFSPSFFYMFMKFCVYFVALMLSCFIGVLISP